jgi:uncharacterized Zn-finger protein
MTTSESNPNTGKRAPAAGGTPNDQSRYEVSRADLPLHCPLPSMSLWNSHPKVYLPIEATGRAKCPYCGTEFTLKD